MAVYNPITGLKRRMPRRLTARKKRKTTSSTVAQRMYAEDAMDSFFAYMVAHKKALFYLVFLAVLGMDFQSEQGRFFGTYFVLAASCYASKAAHACYALILS
jgi:hypothetical protein